MSFNNCWDCYLSYNSTSSTLINDFSRWNTMIPPNFKALEGQKGRTETQKTGRNTRQRMTERKWARSLSKTLSPAWARPSGWKADTVEHKRRRPGLLWGAIEEQNEGISPFLRGMPIKGAQKSIKTPRKKSLGHLVSLRMDFFFLFSLVFETFNPGKPESYYVAEDDLNSQSPCFCFASAGLQVGTTTPGSKKFFPNGRNERVLA